MTLIRSGKREGRKRIHNTKVSKDSSINKSIEGLLRRMKIDREGKQKEKRDLVDLIGRRGVLSFLGKFPSQLVVVA